VSNHARSSALPTTAPESLLELGSIMCPPE
jgi:hypothetical protein